MATWLSITNRLQKRLRETQTATVTTDTYSTLLGELINIAKREVEDYWDWHALRSDLTATTVGGTATANITSSTERCRFYDPARLAYNDTRDEYVRAAPIGMIDRERYAAVTQSGPPSFYEIDSISSGVLVARFWPTPDAAYSIVFPMVVPQADLAADATVLTIPEYPVYLRAYMLALEERGEDGGASYARAESRYIAALAEAIDFDKHGNVGENQMPLEG